MAALRPRTCAECGADFQPAAGHQEFCAPGCKRAFNNRRMVRGAEVYDLLMALRYERPIAQALGVWKLICRLAWIYRDEDARLRAGRNSWRPAAEIIARRPYLRATVVQRKAG